MLNSKRQEIQFTFNVIMRKYRLNATAALAVFSWSACGQLEKKPDAKDPVEQSEGLEGSVSMPSGADALGQGASQSQGGGVSSPIEIFNDQRTSDIAALIQSDSQLYSYIQNALTSATQGAPSAPGAEKELNYAGLQPLESTLELDFDSPGVLAAFSPSFLLANAIQSSAFPSCTSEGEPWDSVTKAVMDPTKREFSQIAFYCQLHATDTTKTVRGALEQNRRLLCDIERTLGSSLVYSAAEKTYSNLAVSLTAGCGWTSQDLASLGRTVLQGQVTTQALFGGDWQKKLSLDFPSYSAKIKSIQVTLFASVTKNSVAFKEIQKWVMKEEKLANQYITQNASGQHGHVIHLDYAAGTLRAEIADTYWGRRVRLYAQGPIDAQTGRFKAVDNLQGIYAKFNKAGDEAHTFVDNSIATVTGNAATGFAYLSGIYHCPQDANCNPNNDEIYTLTILNQSKIHCVPLTAKCTGNSGLSLNTQRGLYDFYMVGAAWDDQAQKRVPFENWLLSAGLPRFQTVDFRPVLLNN